MTQKLSTNILLAQENTFLAPPTLPFGNNYTPPAYLVKNISSPAQAQTYLTQVITDYGETQFQALSDPTDLALALCTYAADFDQYQIYDAAAHFFTLGLYYEQNFYYSQLVASHYYDLGDYPRAINSLRLALDQYQLNPTLPSTVETTLATSVFQVVLDLKMMLLQSLLETYQVTPALELYNSLSQTEKDALTEPWPLITLGRLLLQLDQRAPVSTILKHALSIIPTLPTPQLQQQANDAIKNALNPS